MLPESLFFNFTLKIFYNVIKKIIQTKINKIPGDWKMFIMSAMNNRLIPKVNKEFCNTNRKVVK